MEFYCCNGKGIKVSAKAVLDPGSQHSFVTNNFGKKLHYTSFKRQLNITEIGISSTFSGEMVDIVR